MKKLITNILIGVLLVVSNVAIARIQKQDISKSIVKVYTTANVYNYATPWLSPVQQKGTGSGFVISGNRIITNAHVVANHAFVEVRKASGSKRFQVDVKFIGDDCDLAILTPRDPEFFKDTQVLEIGDMPKILDRVKVYGYPMGGDELSITVGVVSRIESQEYAHSGAYLASAQIDAAINPGNSGGPVALNGKVVGVAYQGLNIGQNLGYMIPSNIIKHFLKDIESGKYNGFPSGGLRLQSMQSPVLREFFGMQAEQTGVLISHVNPYSTVSRYLKKNDVILAINNTNIDNDGTITVNKDLRLSASHLITKQYIGDVIEVKLLRNKKEMDVKVYLNHAIGYDDLVARRQYGISPTYYIYAGLVFQPLTQNYLETYGQDWYYIAPKSFLKKFGESVMTKNHREIVILNKVLSATVNIGYQSLQNSVVAKVNGKKIIQLKDLISAIKQNKNKYDEIVLEDGRKIILDRAAAHTSHKQILQNYYIKAGNSADLG